MRFHSSPGARRYAEAPEEHSEILHRHRTVLGDLPEGSDITSVIVVAVDWRARDLATSVSISRLRMALLLPYDGGVDVLLDDPPRREALRSRYMEWLPSRDDGL